MGIGRISYGQIFMWVAFAERPLHVRELLDGLAYSVTPFELTSATKLHKTALERGKPFIEITPAGLVTFVHSTVKR